MLCCHSRGNVNLHGTLRICGVSNLKLYTAATDGRESGVLVNGFCFSRLLQPQNAIQDTILQRLLVGAWLQPKSVKNVP